MLSRTLHRGLVLLILVVGTVACRPAAPPRDGAADSANAKSGSGLPVVYVVNYPLQYFSERIGGDQIEVRFPIPADVDPAFWKPDDATVRQFQQADVILLNGAGYAKWTQHVSLPESRLVDTSSRFQDRLIQVDDGVVHRHGPGGEHSHLGIAFTTWLDPQLAILQAEQIHAALVERFPASQSTLDTNYRQLRSDLEQLDQQLGEIAARYQGEPLLASHPVYQYLARRCGWNLKSLHWEPEEPPKAGEWDKLTGMLESHPSKWMLWEAEPLRETAEQLTSHGVSSIVFTPCGNRPDGSYLEVMRGNIERLLTIFPK